MKNTTTEITIGTRVALEGPRNEFKPGTVIAIKGNFALVDFDKFDNRWCAVRNLLEVVPSK